MQFSKMSLLAAAVALVSAQDLSQLPSCALSAALGDVQATGCALTDIKCICLAKGLFQELSQALSSKCSSDDQAKALTVAQGLCATVGVCVDDKGVSYDGACPTAPTESSTSTSAAPAETSTSASADSSSAAPSSTSAPAYGYVSASASASATTSAMPSVITVYTTVMCSSSSSVPVPPVTIKTTVSAKPSNPTVKPTASTVPFTGAASSNFAGAGLLSGAAALAIAMLL